jgi:hypothetical protein
MIRTQLARPLICINWPTRCLPSPIFSPFFPIIGSISYASQRQGEGVLMCVAAAIAGLCCLAQIGWPSVIAGLIVLTDVIWPGVLLANLHNNADTTNPFSVALMRTVSPGFGFALLIIAGIMLAILTRWRAEVLGRAPFDCS